MLSKYEELSVVSIFVTFVKFQLILSVFFFPPVNSIDLYVESKHVRLEEPQPVISMQYMNYCDTRSICVNSYKSLTKLSELILGLHSLKHET